MKQSIIFVAILMGFVGNCFADSDIAGRYQMINVDKTGIDKTFDQISVILEIDQNGLGLITKTFSKDGQSCSIQADLKVTYLQQDKIKMDEGFYRLIGGNKSVATECQEETELTSNVLQYRFEDNKSLLVMTFKYLKTKMEYRFKKI